MAVKPLAARIAGHWAAGVPVPVFPAVGADARNRVEALHLRHGVRLVPTPRHATVLLVAGRVPLEHQQRLDRVHDQMPHPRSTLHWGAQAPAPGLVEGEMPRRTPDHVAEGEDPVDALARLQREVLGGGRESDRPRLPDRPAAPWRGLGDHGQGGEGMMGGRPYGRPMAMTADDIRDGLALGQLSVALGPFFPPFPPGLILHLSIQGDLVQEATVMSEPFPQPPSGPLRRVARVLRVAGAAALADRALGLGLSPEPPPAAVRSLRTRLRWSGALRALPRIELPDGGTVRSRLEARLDRAGEGEWDVRKPVVDTGCLPDLLPGLEWADAMLVVATLPLAPPSREGGS